jgi:hypothetical protein
MNFGAIVATHKQNINAHSQNKCHSKKNGAHTARNRSLKRENNTHSKKSVLKQQETTAYSCKSIPIAPNLCPQTFFHSWRAIVSSKDAKNLLQWPIFLL